MDHPPVSRTYVALVVAVRDVSAAMADSKVANKFFIIAFFEF